VSFDIIRRVDEKYKGDSVTQMWNGMQYVCRTGHTQCPIN